VLAFLAARRPLPACLPAFLHHHCLPHALNPPHALPQVLEMEREVLRVLDFDLTQPTIKTFLRRYIKAASGGCA